MPNRIHLIWELQRLNGKEMPHASLMKYTSHKFLQLIRTDKPEMLIMYKAESGKRNHQFWKRDALPVELSSDKVFEQKMDYIHHNPVQDKWCLADEPAMYKYLSAGFYESGHDPFGFLTHCSECR